MISHVCTVWLWGLTLCHKSVCPMDANILEKIAEQLEMLNVCLTHLVDIATSTRHLSESKLGR